MCRYSFNLFNRKVFKGYILLIYMVRNKNKVTIYEHENFITWPKTYSLKCDLEHAEELVLSMKSQYPKISFMVIGHRPKAKNKIFIEDRLKCT